MSVELCKKCGGWIDLDYGGDYYNDNCYHENCLRDILTEKGYLEWEKGQNKR